MSNLFNIIIDNGSGANNPNYLMNPSTGQAAKNISVAGSCNNLFGSTDKKSLISGLDILVQRGVEIKMSIPIQF